MATPGSLKNSCRWFKSKEGCKYGDSCKFSHGLRKRTYVQSSQRNASTSSLGRSGAPAPRNNCNFYWKTGQCQRGFDCTFKHEKDPNPRYGRTNAASGVNGQEDAANAALEFFTMDNLAQMTGVGLHSTQEGTPEDAHNLIKRYLEGGSLNRPTDMKQLICIMASVNRRNHSWVSVNSSIHAG